jgi:hypothetical protein
MALHLDPHDHRPEERMRGAGIEAEDYRPATTAATLATGSMICPQCELPIAVGTGLPATSYLICPFCDHAGEARSFLRRDVRDTRSNRVDLIARIV